MIDSTFNADQHAHETTEIVASVGNENVIPSFDYRRGLQLQHEEISNAIERVLDSGTLILGPEGCAFEREFAQFVGSSYAVGMSSGTDALIVALRALKVGYGHEVITVANGPVPTVAAIRAVGATPTLVDVDSTLQIDPCAVLKAVNPATRCVIPIHLYGIPADTTEIARICLEKGLEMIEDCSQAHGTRIDGNHVGNLGAIGCYSFYPTKNLGAFGDAGMCVTCDADLTQRIREIGQFGYRTHERIACSEGLNCRLDELQAACLRVRLRHLTSNVLRRQRIAEYYLEKLKGLPIGLPCIPSNGSPSWHQFVIRVQQRSKWISFLSERQIRVGVHYEWPVHRMPAFALIAKVLGEMQVTERACSEVLSLPMFPELRADELERVVQAIRHGVDSGLM